MSSADPVNLRPPPRPLRIAVLIAAIACLGLTMCVRSEQKPAPARPAARPAPQAQSPEAPAPKPAAETKAPPPKPDYFPATKAPGEMYR